MKITVTLEEGGSVLADVRDNIALNEVSFPDQHIANIIHHMGKHLGQGWVDRPRVPAPIGGFSSVGGAAR